MKTNYLKITAAVKIPEQWDAATCDALKARIAAAVEAGLAETREALALIDGELELAAELHE